MADLFKLVGSIFIDNEQANDSLQKTDKEASNVGQTLGNVAKGAAAVGTAVIAGAAAVGTSVVAMASDSATSMDVIDKASQRMGIAAESYQELAHAASLSGVEMSTLEKAAKKLEGTDINLDQALESIYSLETAEERAKAAAELFGDSVAYQLTPMLNASGEQFDAMRQEAVDLGLVFSGDAVSAGAALNDALSNVKDATGSLMTSLGNELMPVVMEFCQLIISYMPQIQALFQKIAPIITQAFQALIPPIIQMIDQLLPVIFSLIEQLLPPIMQIISSLLPAITSLLTSLLPILVQLVQMVLPIIVQLVTALAPLLGPIISLLTPILQLVTTLLQPLLQLINMILPPIIALVKALAEILTQALGVAIKWIVDKFTEFREKTRDTFEKVREFIRVPIEKITNFFNNLRDTVRKVVETVVDKFFTFRDKVRTIFEQVIDFVRRPVNSVIGFLNNLISGVVSGINTVIRAINRVHVDVPDWLANLTGVHSIGFNLAEITAPQIPYLAKGGEVEGSAIVGEDGPELLQTNGKKTKVTPLNDNNNDFVELSHKMDELLRILKDGFGVYLDGRTVVGQLAPEMDSALGRLAVKQGRRV